MPFNQIPLVQNSHTKTHANQIQENEISALSEIHFPESELKLNENFSFTQINDAIAMPGNALISGGISRVSECERRWEEKKDLGFDGQLFCKGNAQEKQSKELWEIFNKMGLKRVKEENENCQAKVLRN